MSDPQDSKPADKLPHERRIRTPQQLTLTAIASFVLPIIGITLLVSYVGFGDPSDAGGSGSGSGAGAGAGAMTVAARIQPVGRVELRDASAPVVVRSGEAVYTAVCTACHSVGAAGAPKTGDAAAWAPRIKTGYEALLSSVVLGKGAMSKQGGGEYSDEELGRAVVFLANRGGAKFDEPKAVAGPASSSAATAACQRAGAKGTVAPQAVSADAAAQKVVGDGRLQFLAEPDAACQQVGVFILPGETVSAEERFGDFTKVRYRNPRTGTEARGWVFSNRLSAAGVNPPRE